MHRSIDGAVGEGIRVASGRKTRDQGRDETLLKRAVTMSIAVLYSGDMAAAREAFFIVGVGVMAWIIVFSSFI